MCVITSYSIHYTKLYDCRTCHPRITPRRYPVCPHCGNRSSLTTGTLMHGAKKPLRDWLLTIWWFSAAPFDVSAKELQRLLGLSCYQTAWTWLQKLRLASITSRRPRMRTVFLRRFPSRRNVGKISPQSPRGL